MSIDQRSSRFRVDASAIVRSDERVFLLFLILLSIVALAVFLHYAVLIVDGLPEVVPSEPPRP